MSTPLNDWAGPLREQINALLMEPFEDASPGRLGEACQYPIQTGGKRIRPLFTLAAHQSLGGEISRQTLLAACAVEMVHGYSLVHDDLPAMDDDDERRGKPTVHKIYGEDGGVLVGDAMLTEAFALLGQLPDTQCAVLVRELALAAGHRGMIGGQAWDVGMGGPIKDVEMLRALHRGKTGALIRCAVRFGAITGGADDGQLQALTRYGEAVGLAFQLADDVLDEAQDAGSDGPPSFVRLLGVDETRRQADALLQQALDALRAVPSPQTLEALARFTVNRDH
ncbi:MAG: polyprenyl synthetase family protein [Myxococcota bacterium]